LFVLRWVIRIWGTTLCANVNETPTSQKVY
jgi:hypothetical protein